MTRSQNSFLNLITGAGSQLLLLVLGFVFRTAFLRYLGEAYLGLEGTFSSVLSMLSLTEMGLGSAIVFRLYKPIEENDQPRMRVLMKLYRQAYLVIGGVILALGLLLIPALPLLVKNYDQLSRMGLNALLIYILYLLNTVFSYWFFAYKSAFVEATQKTYLLTVMSYGIDIFWCLVNLFCLAVLHSFTAYIFSSLILVVVRNFLYAKICDRRHPFLRVPTEEHISKEELRDFFKDCSALFVYKVCNRVVGGSDSLVLSSMLGLEAVAVYTNIYGALRINLQNLLYKFNAAMDASLGSIYSTGNLEWSRLSFRVVNFCCAWLYGVGAIGLALLSDEFITLWVGAQYTVTSWTVNGVTIATPVALLAGVETYLAGQTYYCGSFRYTMGLFQELKYRPVATIIVNLSLSILLVPRLGIAACLVSTIIAYLTTTLLVDPIVICRVGLKQSVWPYIRKNLLYKAVVLASGLLCWYLCRQIPLTGVPGFIVRGAVCVAAPSAIFTACFFRTTEFRFVVRTARDLLVRRSAAAPARPEDKGEPPHDA